MTNKLFPIITIVFLLLSSFVVASAQNDERKNYQVSPRQSAYIFDTYNPNDISPEDEKQKLELFALRVKDTLDARGYIRIYRGSNDYKFDYQKRAEEINNYLAKLSKDKELKWTNFNARLEGFRNESSIELIIEPVGSKSLSSSSTVSFLDLRYYNDAVLEEGTIQKTGRELLEMLIKRVEPPFPAAARAIRASGEVVVLTKIDEKGTVIEAKAFRGHPLLRAACVYAVKQWQFKPEIRNNVAVKVVGITTCDFKSDDSIIINTLG